VDAIISSTASNECNQSTEAQCQSESVCSLARRLRGVGDLRAVVVVRHDKRGGSGLVSGRWGRVLEKGEIFWVGSSPQTILLLISFLAWHERHVVRDTSQHHKPNRCHNVIATSRNKRRLLAWLFKKKRHW
jgi:hypothetical protein